MFATKILHSINFFLVCYKLLDYLHKNDILPYDEHAAEWHAKERARLASLGQMAAFVDGQISAIAKVNSLVLVTRNSSDFKKFSGLQLENWHVR